LREAQFIKITVKVFDALYNTNEVVFCF